MKSSTFPKRERITSQKTIDLLFGNGQSKSFMVFPLRAVWFFEESSDASSPPIQLFVSVPKKRLRHAVDRNRSKRQVREAFRLQKAQLLQTLPPGKQLRMALVWQSNRLESSALVSARMAKILARIADSL